MAVSQNPQMGERIRLEQSTDCVIYYMFHIEHGGHKSHTDTVSSERLSNTLLIKLQRIEVGKLAFQTHEFRVLLPDKVSVKSLGIIGRFFCYV